MENMTLSKNNANWIRIRFVCQYFVNKLANKMAEYKTMKTF
jgi:hypothetical protein